jgi:integral membrane protein
MNQAFRWVTLVEGISYVLLLFIAMPLKYIAGIPEGVRILGMAHGVLFVTFCVLLALMTRRHQWNYKFSMGLFLSSLVPIASFFMDRKIKDACGLQ